MRKPISHWIISTHAKEQLEKRYGICFSQQNWDIFCKTLQNEKNAILLTGGDLHKKRFACYFQNQWFIAACSFEGNTPVITTILPADSSKEADKTLLQNDERYCRINHGLPNVPVCEYPLPPLRQKRLPKLPILPEELPPDFDLAEKLLGGTNGT